MATGPRCPPCIAGPTSTARPRWRRTTSRRRASCRPTASRRPLRSRATDADEGATGMTHAAATVDEMRPPYPAERGLDVYNTKLGLCVFLASEVTFFSALIASYIILR